MDNKAKIKKETQADRIEKLLLQEGFREITDEERKTDWYKEELKTLNCPFTNEEFNSPNKYF